MVKGGAVRRELAAVCRRLHELGFTPGSSGNVSARSGADAVLITPSGIGMGEVEADDLVEMGLDGTVAGGGRPSTEAEVHTLVYRRRADVNAIVHAHSPGCMAFAMAGRDFGEPCNLEILATVGRPVLVPFAPPGESGAYLAPFLERADCFLLANHGVLVLGESLRQAAFRIEEVENFACSLIAARRLGGEKPFSSDELARIKGFLERVGVARPRSVFSGG